MTSLRRLSQFGLAGLATIAAILAGRTAMYGNRTADQADRLAEASSPAQTLAPNTPSPIAAPTKPAGRPPMMESPVANPAPIVAVLPADRSSQSHRLQLGTNFLADWSNENLFIDRLKTFAYPQAYGWQFDFRDGRWNTAEAQERGVVDPVSGDPTAIPPGLQSLQTPVLLRGYKQFPEYFKGDWVLTWAGSARPVLGVHLKDRGIRLIDVDEGKRRAVFRMPATGGAPFRMKFVDIETPVHSLRLVRLEDEAAANDGVLWNPDYIEYAGRHDILRTMVSQATNEASVRQWNHVARPDDPHFTHRQPFLTPEQKPAHGRYGLPYEFVFDLALAADTQLWLTIPIQIGSPVEHHLYKEDMTAFKQAVSRSARDIIASSAWEEFAREFSDRLRASGYPVDRPLFIEIGNEIWNYGYPFLISTNYADAIAAGLKSGESHRYAYGILTARFMLALEDVLAQTPYRITYVVAGQTANPSTTRDAYRGLMDHLRAADANVNALIAKTGVAVTSYHGGQPVYKRLITPRETETLLEAWEREIAADPSGLSRRLRSYFTQSDDTVPLTKKWILKRWAAHAAAAREVGATFIGAYEGGSHDTPLYALTQSETFVNWWKEYHWGPHGVAVIREINAALLAQHPGTILSNFVSMGTVGEPNNPWIDGFYTRPTAMLAMWTEFESQSVSSPPDPNSTGED